MRELQDNFYNKVGIKTGLTRLGPGGRRRLTRAEWQAEKQKSRALANAKAVASSGYRAGLKKAKAEATEIVAQAQEKAKGLGVKMSGWFAGLAGGWHQPSASAVAKATKVKEEAQKAQEEAQKAKEQAKKWADERVATVGNQIILEKSKNAELEKEVKTKDQKLEDQATLIQWYQKKFGKAPDNLPKLK
jgi:predicted trehalose synthase